MQLINAANAQMVSYTQGSPFLTSGTNQGNLSSKLGLFAGIYCYCLIVLRTIRGGDEGGFVPGLAVLLGVILAVAGISVLIYFIHHIATSIQASNIIASVADETMSAIDRLYPDDVDAMPVDGASTVQDLPRQWKPIPSPRDGYIDGIDFPALDELARANRTIVRIEHGIGDFVVRGSPLFVVSYDTVDVEELATALTGTVAIGRHRTLEQDAGFGIRQLVDIALRALSPGINDTTTAIMCIDYLTAILSRLGTRMVTDNGAPSADGSRRVINPHAPDFAALLAEAFDQIREGARAQLRGAGTPARRRRYDWSHAGRSQPATDSVRPRRPPGRSGGLG